MLFYGVLWLVRCQKCTIDDQRFRVSEEKYFGINLCVIPDSVKSLRFYTVKGSFTHFIMFRRNC